MLVHDDPSTGAFRNAFPMDVPRLLSICRGAFPHDLRWGRSAGGRWWNTAIRSNAAEVWVDAAARDIRGLLLLVIDESTWKQERRKRGGRRQLLLSALQRPSAPALRTIRHLKGQHSSSSAVEGLRSIDPIPAFQRVWLELIAVDAHHRGNGVGRKLLTLAETRARRLGRPAIQLSVRLHNAAALRLYAANGYGLVRHGAQSAVLGKRL